MRNFIKYSGIGVGVGSLAAAPAIISNCEDDSGNIVANVNGGIRFFR